MKMQITLRLPALQGRGAKYPKIMQTSFEDGTNGPKWKKHLPLGVLLDIKDALQQGRPEDAEGEEEAHGEAEEEGGGEAVGEHHDVVVGGEALLLEDGARLLEDGGARGGRDGDEDGEEKRHREQGDVQRLLEVEGMRSAGELQRGVRRDLLSVFGHFGAICP